MLTTDVSGTDYTVTVNNISGDGTVGITLLGAGIQDVADNFLGGGSGVNQTSSTFTIDNTQPTVVVTDNHADPDDSTDDTVSDSDNVMITATFTEANSLGGTPTITIGTSVTSASMTSTADPLIWTYTWNVPTGDDPSEVVSITAPDQAGNALGTQTNTNAGDYEIDNTAPTVSIAKAATTTGSNSTSTSDNSVTFQMVYGSDIDVNTIAAVDYTVSTTGSIGFTGTSAGGTVFNDQTFTVSGISGDGTMGVTITTTGVQDIAGNDLSSTGATLSPAAGFTIDNTAPGVTLTRNTTSTGTAATSTSDNSVSFDIAFDQTIDNATLTLDDIQINIASGASVGSGTANTTPTVASTINGQSGNTGTVVLTTDVAGTDYTVTINNISGDGTVGITLAGSGIQDIADNFLGGGSGVDQTSSTFTIDNTQPTVVVTDDHADPDDSTDDTVRDADNVTITATFTETNNLGGTPTITIGTSVTSASMTSTADPKVWTYTWNVPTGDDPSEAVSITAPDQAGNALGTQTNTNAGDYEIDNTAPTVSIAKAATTTGSNSTSTSDNSLTFNMTYASDIDLSTITAVDYSVSTTGTVGFTGSAVGGSAANDQTFTVSGVFGDGTMGVSISTTGIQDVAGNDLSSTGATLAAASGFTIDNTAPGVTLTRNTTSTGTAATSTSDNSVSFDIAFDQTIDNATLTLDDIQINIASGASVGSGTANTTPTVASTINGQSGNTGTVVLTTDVSGTDYTLTINNISGDGTVGITLAGSGIQDVADNFLGGGSGVDQTSSTFTIDNTQPTVVVTDNHADPDDATDDTVNDSDNVTITATFTEANALSGTPNITIGTSVTSAAMTSTANALVWTYTWNVPTGDDASEVVSISVSDQAGNAVGTQTNTNAGDYEIDNTAPTLASLAIVSSQTASETFVDNKHAATGNTITLTMDFNEDVPLDPTAAFTSGLVAISNSVTYTQTDAVNDIWTAVYTINSGDTDGATNFNLSFTDVAGNTTSGITNSSLTGGGATQTVEVDKAVPTVESLTIARTSGTDNTSGNGDFVKDGDQVTITVDFNDDLSSGFPTITNLQSGSVAMANAGSAVITQTDATNKIWTIVFNVAAADTDGSISFQINFTDDAGNMGTAATQANITNGSSVTVDNTAPTSTISAAIGSSNTQIIVTFNENVATNGTNPTDFTVVDEDSNNYAVSAQANGTAEDTQIVLTVADFSSAEGDLLVTYTNNNGEIFDLANNAAPTSATATIERTFTGQVSLTEITTGTVGTSGGDTNSAVAMYRTTTSGVNIFTGTPVTFTPSVEGSTITIYRDAALTDPVTGAQQTSVTKATGWTPTINLFLADEGLTLGSSTSYNADANDINGVYTFYITETAVNGTDSRGSAVTYSLAFLDNIDNTNNRTNFSVGESATTDLRVGNALSQELQITGVAIGSPVTAAGTSFVNSEATNITSAQFNASIVGQGTYPLDFQWINATSNVSAKFENVVTLAITPVVSPFFESSQKVNFSRSETQQDLLINSNPSGVDVAVVETDGGDADFYDLEIYYIQNGSILTSIGSAGVNSSAGGEISSALIYSGTTQAFGSPSGAASTDWDINPSAIDAFLDANVTSGRSVIDTLVIAYITANDNATSSSDLTVNTRTNLYLFEPVSDIVTQETNFTTEYFTCEGDAINAIATSNAAEEATYIWYTDDGDLTFDAGDTEITRSTTLTNANILNKTTTYTATDGTGQTTRAYTNTDGTNGTVGIYYFWVHHVRGATSSFLGTTSSATLIAVTVFDDATEPVFNGNTAVAANNSNNVDFTLFYDASELTESVTFSATSGGNFAGATFNPSASTSDVADAASITNEFRWYASNSSGTRGTQITSGASVTAQQLQLTGLTADADRYIYLEEVTNIVRAADGTTTLYDGCTSNGVVILFSVKVKPAAPTGTTSFFYCEGETVANLTMNGEAGNSFRWLDRNNNLLHTETADASGVSVADVTSELGIGATPVDSVYTIKVYQVSDIVSTSTNSSSIAPDSVNIPFQGAISDTTVITIDVKEVPVAPVLDSPVNGVQYCDDVSTQLSIGFTDDGNADLFRIYQGDGVTRSDDLSATQSAILFDLSEADYLAGMDSTIFISQVSFSGEGGAAFAGCESPRAQVNVHPNPEFTSFANGSSLINIVEACEVGITAAISIDNLNTLTEENFRVDWRIDDALRTESSNFNIEVDQTYNAGSSISLDISVVNQTTMCSANISETRIIGVTPIADFTINNITENNNTALVVRDNNPDVTNTLVESISMTITDDGGNTVFQEVRAGGEDSGILNSEFNSDFAAGSYSATMFTVSTSGCTDDQALAFNILPQVTISEDTVITFDAGNLESWFAEEDRNVSGELDDQNVRQLVGNSWDLDTPAGIQIFEDPDRNPESIMWITNRTGEYNAREVSYVYSPSFNIDIERPAISFDYYLDMASNDGVVLQYSTNDGDTWNTLGEPSTGISWYNEAGVPSNPGGVEGNPERFAWSGDGGINWLTATHAVSGDDLTTLRFRFALGSRDAETKDGAEGFAFDNFRVFSRDRTTLLETFTSTQIWDDVDSTNAMKSTVYVKENFPGDIVVINYFTNLGDDEDNNRIDPIYDQNPSDPNARLAFYGINEIETGVLGGIEVGTDFVPAQGEADIDANTGNLGFVEGDYSQDLLKPTSVRMNLSASLQEDANVVDISLDVNTDFPEGLNPFNVESQISTRVMILQESVGGEGLIENVPGDVVFQNVLREVITGSSGITNQGVIENNTQFVDFTESWEVSGIFANQEVDSVTMIVVAFVQDELTREILQVEETTVRVAVPETVTSIHPDFFSSRESYDIYPNPAENVFTVELEKPTMMDLNWVLIDQSGKKVVVGDIQRGNQTVEVITDHLSSGLYFFQLYNNDHVWDSQRVMIMKGSR